MQSLSCDGGARPPVQAMITFIDDSRADLLGAADRPLDLPRSCRQAAHVAKLSACAKKDAALKIEVRRVFDQNFSVYGVRKVWRQLKREGFDVARCTVSRLMQEIGLQAVK